MFHYILRAVHWCAETTQSLSTSSHPGSVGKRVRLRWCSRRYLQLIRRLRTRQSLVKISRGILIAQDRTNQSVDVPFFYRSGTTRVARDQVLVFGYFSSLEYGSWLTNK